MDFSKCRSSFACEGSSQNQQGIQEKRVQVQVYTYDNVNVYMYLSVYLSTYLPACIPVCPSIRPSLCLSIHMFIYLSIYLSIYLFPIYLSVCLSTCLSIYAPMYRYVCMMYGCNDVWMYGCVYVPIHIQLYMHSQQIEQRMGQCRSNHSTVLEENMPVCV